ncbi:DHHC palmitoyltransferase-domain-containing protein [Lasiosphaeria miniovina]|uniref:Palmitoyltransferase PFA4 n=1 Tax=Lasiosphaeria miniovina TaxID=1954250 RepID=A0AA40BH91_9PEZI|nr:DHHC palmitoyltransferase-domain-containing protein [Lasiosphaeria miniovina]KAK0734207.1 DHHC palmitoyltransferase-domain-containing protein [Lasiosphaeria miniovina]
MTSSLKTGPSTTALGLQALAVPGVCLLIGFLGYVSQLLFYTAPDLAPGPLTTPESVVFNLLLACLWWTYYKACTVEPGRYPPPNPHDPTPSAESEKYRPTSTATTTTTTTTTATETTTTITTTLRWCKKCRAPKPLRAHHCRHCGRCIPKMDHHCPWTGNCVSMQTFPYFLRFLVFTNLSLWVLGSFVWERMAMIWSDRHLPAYLGPTLPHLVLLTAVSLVGSGTAIALGLLLFTTARGWILNATMIEDWEVERHEAVLARQQRHDREDDSESDDYDDNDGKPRSRRQAFWQDTDPIIPRVEYPYDIGVFANMAQGMGTRNALKWFLPWAGGPVVDASGRGWGWEWEENRFNSRAGMWPPPDPEKLRRNARGAWPAAEKYAAAVAAASSTALSGEETKAAFAARQQADLIRRGHQRPAPAGPIHGEDNDDIMAELEEQPDNDEDYDDYDSDGGDGGAGQAWKDSESNTLWDYGVDEDAEEDDARPFAARLQKVEEEPRVIELDDDDDDDDEVPLAELIRRRKVRTTDGGED